jgi:hypothetical protein
MEAMSDRQLIELLWEYFGMAVDYTTDRKTILKTLRQLAA